MSRNDWNVDKYREEYESAEQWELRKSFIERWKDNYPEDKLLCLARVFVNMEFMGCRYPTEVMKEVAALSEEVAQEHRHNKKDKLQRTFVSASDAAEDRAKGVKRKGGIITSDEPNKSAKISFVPQGFKANNEEEIAVIESDEESKPQEEIETDTTTKSDVKDPNEYYKEMQNTKCLDLNHFRESMFNSPFGRLVLLIRPWTTKLSNIQASCASCRLTSTSTYDNGCFSFFINNVLVGRATGATKAEARSVVETIVWNRIRLECVSVLIKEQWIARGDAPITSDDVAGPRVRDEMFGTPIESSRATKMMKLMGWTGGGLGAEAQGIAEPIKPHLQMVNRAGLGSAGDVSSLRRAGDSLMRRYLHSECLDVDLVFSSEFTKEERATLHQAASRLRLHSNSYGKGDDRFLVVKKKIDPFSIVRAVLEKGGSTPKYQVFLPISLQHR